MQNNPFKYGQISNLTDLGLDSKFFKFNVTHMESERYISVRDVDANGTPQLTIVELFNKMNLVRRPGSKVDGCVMHLKQNIVALKAPNEGKGHILQIFNMDSKKKLKHIEFGENIYGYNKESIFKSKENSIKFLNDRKNTQNDKNCTFLRKRYS